MLARYTAASILVGFLSLFCYHAFPPASATPGLTAPMHSFVTPLALTAFYLASLPALRFVAERFLAPRYDMKSLLTESMVVYNLSQVALNGWMVYAMVDAVVRGGHPFVGSRGTVGVSITSGASYAVWAHYCDKYLEFFDTYFMVLRGKMDQVSFFFGRGVVRAAMTWKGLCNWPRWLKLEFGGVARSSTSRLITAHVFYPLSLPAKIKPHCVTHKQQRCHSSTSTTTLPLPGRGGSP